MDLQAECQRAAMYAAEGFIDSAIRLYQSILQHDPNLLDAQAGLARLLLQAGQWDAAHRLIQHVLVTNPKHYQTYLLLGLAKERADLSGAIALLQQACQIGSHDPMVHYHLARILLKHSDDLPDALDHAFAAINLAHQRAPQMPTVLQLRARVLRRMGHNTECRRLLKEAIRLNPRHLPSYITLIDLEMKEGNLDETLFLLREAHRWCGAHPALASLEMSMQTIRGHWDEAAQSAQKLARQLPQSFAAHLQLGILHLLQGQSDKAEVELLQSHRLNPQHWEPLFLLGQLYKHLQQFQPAFRYLRESSLRAPDRWQPLNELGLVCLQVKDFDDALHFFSLALQLAPDETTPLFNTALAYFKKQDWSQARTFCEHLLKLPGLPQPTREATALLRQQMEIHHD